MTTSIRHDFHADLASTIATDIQYQRSNYYYFLGKIDTWGPGDLPPVSSEVDSEFENNNIRANAVYIKKIEPADVSLVSTRYDWISGTVFDPWDHTKNMRGLNFYCVTTAGNVYKCLNNSAGAASTIEPTGTSFDVITGADGYTWKYMYSIPAFKKTRFMSGNYIPVQKALSDGFYSKGAVSSVLIVSGGSGYSSAPVTAVTVSGGSVTGAGASATVNVNGLGVITGITLISGGTGYTHGVVISVTSGTGSGANITAIVSGGVITGFTIVSGGSGYLAAEPLVFTVGGAVIVPTLSPTGAVTALTIVNPGVGYTTSPTLTISGGGSGVYGNASAVLTCLAYAGSIVSTAIIDPGVGYSLDISTTITVQGDGTGASFYPVISNGAVVAVGVNSPGINYTAMKLTVVGTGTGAKLTPIIYASDYNSAQSIVEQTTVVGAIYSIEISNGGTNYTAATTVTIEGDGTGCVVTPTVAGGAITKLTIVSPGSGYTYANVVVEDANRTLIGTVVDAQLYAVLPPSKGHGFDAVSELFGETLVINSSLRQDVSLNSLYQDYRQFGILKNPTSILTGKVFTDNSSLIAYKVQMADVTDLVVDEILISDDKRYRVVSIIGVTVTLQPLGITTAPPLGILLAEAQQTRVYSSVKLLSSPLVNKFSGKLLYVSDEEPFSFSEDQGIVIKTFLKF